MKNLLLLLFVSAVLVLSSCRKDRTCDCTNTTTYMSTSEVETTTETIGHATKREAKREAGCYSHKSTITQNGVAYQVSSDCKLK